MSSVSPVCLFGVCLYVLFVCQSWFVFCLCLVVLSVLVCMSCFLFDWLFCQFKTKKKQKKNVVVVSLSLCVLFVWLFCLLLSVCPVFLFVWLFCLVLSVCPVFLFVWLFCLLLSVCLFVLFVPQMRIFSQPKKCTFFSQPVANVSGLVVVVVAVVVVSGVVGTGR